MNKKDIKLHKVWISHIIHPLRRDRGLIQQYATRLNKESYKL